MNAPPTPTHPWQHGPQELFQSALSLLDKGDGPSYRIAFLLLDVCVETALRTYLALPHDNSEVGLGYKERRTYAGGNFHELITGVGFVDNSFTKDIDPKHLRFYHDIRNRLYHNGNGITVDSGTVQAYASLTSRLLSRLLDIRIPVALESPQIKPGSPSKEQMALLREQFGEAVQQYRHLISLHAETREPKMVYPSTLRKLAEIADFGVLTFASKATQLRDLIDANISNSDLRRWLLSFVADDLAHDRPQKIANTQFIMELGKDPISFYSFAFGIRLIPFNDITADSLDDFDDISFIAQDDYSVLGLHDISHRFESDFSDSRRYGMTDNFIYERCGGLLQKLQEVNPKLEALLKGAPRPS